MGLVGETWVPPVQASETNSKVWPFNDEALSFKLWLLLAPLISCLHPCILSLPHLFSGKGNWDQSKDLSKDLTELAEAQSLLTQLRDGIPCQ